MLCRGGDGRDQDFVSISPAFDFSQNPLETLLPIKKEHSFWNFRNSEI